MHKETVEIYSTEPNFSVIKPPGRKFPGSLIQGDDLYQLCRRADEACSALKHNQTEKAFGEINQLRNALWKRLTHYKKVLVEHDIKIPFVETPSNPR